MGRRHDVDDGTENDDRLQHVDGIYGMSASHDRKTALSTNNVFLMESPTPDY